MRLILNGRAGLFVGQLYQWGFALYWDKLPISVFQVGQISRGRGHFVSLRYIGPNGFFQFHVGPTHWGLYIAGHTPAWMRHGPLRPPIYLA